MKRTLYAVVATAAILASGLSQAEVYYQGKVYQTTADKLIQRDHLPCAYGEWRLETLPNGTTILTRGKRCESGWTSGR